MLIEVIHKDASTHVFQVVGPLHQNLANDWRYSAKSIDAAALFSFIFHERAMIVRGSWDDEVNRYVEHGTDLSLIHI